MSIVEVFILGMAIVLAFILIFFVYVIFEVFLIPDEEDELEAEKEEAVRQAIQIINDSYHNQNHYKNK